MSTVLSIGDNGPEISSASEDDLQRGMFELAQIYGWRAQREVVIPGWGRLDLVLHASDSDDFACVIEFKQALNRASSVRKAFQQADGYHRWLRYNRGVTEPVVLAPVDMDESLVNDAAYAYRESVRLMYAGEVMALITGSHFIESRMARARAVHEATTSRYRLTSHAMGRMSATYAGIPDDMKMGATR